MVAYTVQVQQPGTKAWEPIGSYLTFEYAERLAQNIADANGRRTRVVQGYEVCRIYARRLKVED